MSTDHHEISVGWDFETLAFVWDPRTNAISAGSDRLASLSGPERSQSLANLRKRVR